MPDISVGILILNLKNFCLQEYAVHRTICRVLCPCSSWNQGKINMGLLSLLNNAVRFLWTWGVKPIEVWCFFSMEVKRAGLSLERSWACSLQQKRKKKERNAVRKVFLYCDRAHSRAAATESEAVQRLWFVHLPRPPLAALTWHHVTVMFLVSLKSLCLSAGSPLMIRLRKQCRLRFGSSQKSCFFQRMKKRVEWYKWRTDVTVVFSHIYCGINAYIFFEQKKKKYKKHSHPSVLSQKPKA